MSKLCSNAANCGLKKIQDALPVSLKTKISQSINVSTYVFVLKNIEQAQKLLKFLEEKGFSNISIDSKGTTITAQSQSADNDSGTLGCRASKLGKACKNYTIQNKCSSHYIISGTAIGNICRQCMWSSGIGICTYGCNTCPP